jgi:hypothetical protein
VCSHARTAGQKWLAEEERMYGRGLMGQKRWCGRAVPPFEFGCGFGVFVGEVFVFGVGGVGVNVRVT